MILKCSLEMIHQSLKWCSCCLICNSWWDIEESGNDWSKRAAENGRDALKLIFAEKSLPSVWRSLLRQLEDSLVRAFLNIVARGIIVTRNKPPAIGALDPGTPYTN
ncbi:hypothetical protein NC652_023460 [Populus alba x Populus x berolinensis]|nr:hypothetical protein NC652_023460 [Populus alba x Populus x berolinensis]